MSEQSVIIEPKKGWAPVNFKEIWAFKGLLYFLAWRDLKVKYKQAALGVIWTILQPIATMVVFTVVFGRFAGMPSDNVPYPIFVYLGLLPWNYFSVVLGQSTNSLVSGSSLLSKIYFPRIIIPFSSSIVALLDFVIAFTVMIFMILYFGVNISAGVVLVPFLVFITMINAVGFGLWFSALNVRYRDVQYVIPFLIQIWMFLTPVIYPKSMLGDKWGWVLLLNPMGGVIETFRAAMLGHVPIPWAALLISSFTGLAVFAGGVYYFRRVERLFADII